MDRFENARIFAAVVEAGGFTRAAERLGLSRAATSKHVLARGYKAVLQRFEQLPKSGDEAGSSRYGGRSTPTICSRLALNNNGARRAWRSRSQTGGEMLWG
jgi:hypothetical protein